MLVIGNGRMITRDASKAFIENGAVAMDGNTIKMVGVTDEVKKAKEEGTEVAKVMEYCRQNMIIDIKDNENNSAYTVVWKYRSGFFQKTGRSETTGCYADFCKKAGCESL